MAIDVRRITPLPVPPIRTQRDLKSRHAAMQHWHALAQNGRDTPEYESWRRMVDRFLAAVEGSIFLMGYNPLDHGRRREKA